MIDNIANYLHDVGAGIDRKDVTLRDRGLRRANVSSRRADEPIQIGYFDYVGIDEDKISDAQVRQLLDDDGAGAAQSDDGYPRVLKNALTVSTKRPNLPVMVLQGSDVVTPQVLFDRLSNQTDRGPDASTKHSTLQS